MKKLLVAAIGAVAAYGASAGSISEQRFEDVTGELPLSMTISELNTLAGAQTQVGFWSGDEITNTYKAVLASGFPQDKPLGTPTKALEVKTKFGNPLSLNAIDGGSATNIPASGIYFDSLVKFTVCDDVPEQAYDGAKIIMWLQESEVNNQTTTNIMVRAGYVNSDYTCATNDYVCYQFTGNIEQYHRVTIKTWASIFDGNDVPGFAIFLDGVKVNIADGMAMDSSVSDSLKEATTLIGANAVFPSIVQGNAAGKSTISSVAFDGTGYITDLVFTDEAPFAAAEDYVAPGGTLVVGGVEQDPWYTLDELATTLNGIAAAVQGETTTVEVQLSKDIRFAGPVTINNEDEDVEIIIDLHGCQIVNTASSGYAIICESPVTITDTTEQKLGAIVSDLQGDDSGAIYVGEAGVLSLQAGTIDGQIDLHESASAILTGGTVKQDSIDPADGYKLVQRGAFYDVVPLDTFTIKFVYGADLATTNETEVTKGVTPTAPDAATVAVAGKTFTGWDTKIVPAVADATYTAVYETIKVNVIFVDGDTATTNGVDYGTTLTAESAPAFVGRTGYTAAWDKTVAGTTVTAETTFTAVYTGKTFTIVTYTNGVENTSKEFTYAGVSVDPADPLYDSVTETWDGKWYTTNGGSTEFAFDAAGELTQNAYATIETKGGSVVPDIPAGGETDCGTAEAATAAAAAINADAASKAAHIAVPTGADAGTYLGYVEAVAVGTKVKVDFSEAGATVAQTSANTDVVSEAVSAAVAAAAAAGSEGSGTASVSTVAGFYYSIVSGTSPTAVTTEGTRVLGTGGSVNLTVPNKGPAGFYKVKVSARAAD